MPKHYYGVLIASVLLAISTLAGCTSPGSSSDTLTVTEVAERYRFETKTAKSTPVFVLVPGYKDPKDGYARDLLARQCLERIVEYRVVTPGSEAGGLIDARTGQLRFNEQIAAEFGYPQVRLPEDPDSAVPDDVEVTPTLVDEMRECGDKNDKRLGIPPEVPLENIEREGWEAVERDPSVRQAVESWRTCMAPAEVVDLPNGPADMPTKTVVPLVGATESMNDADIPLTSREREVAVIDARCRAEVGYDQAILQARSEAELEAIGANIEEFEASRRAYEEYGLKLGEVVDELG